MWLKFERNHTFGTTPLQSGVGITGIHLTVRANVPGLSQEDFVEAAEGAKANCPVSKALAGVENITLDAALV